MKADKFTLLGGGGALLVIIAAFAYANRKSKAKNQDEEVVQDHMAKMRAAKAAKKEQEVELDKPIKDANESTESPK